MPSKHIKLSSWFWSALSCDQKALKAKIKLNFFLFCFYSTNFWKVASFQLAAPLMQQNDVHLKCLNQFLQTSRNFTGSWNWENNCSQYTLAADLIGNNIRNRGKVKDTKLEAKDSKKIRGQGQQGQPFRGQTLSRPRAEMLEAKAKDQGPRRKRSPKKKKKRSPKIFFRRSPIHWRIQNFWLGEA